MSYGLKGKEQHLIYLQSLRWDTSIHLHNPKCVKRHIATMPWDSLIRESILRIGTHYYLLQLQSLPLWDIFNSSI